MLIAVLTHILFVTFFSLFVFHLQVDVVGPLLLNASLLLVPGNVREFDSGQGNVRDSNKSQGNVREKILYKLPKTVYCKLHICIHTYI